MLLQTQAEQQTPTEPHYHTHPTFFHLGTIISRSELRVTQSIERRFQAMMRMKRSAQHPVGQKRRAREHESDDEQGICILTRPSLTRGLPRVTKPSPKPGPGRARSQRAAVITAARLIRQSQIGPMKVSKETIEKIKQKAAKEATHRTTTNKAPKQTNSSNYPPSPTFIGYNLGARLPLDEATKKATAGPFNPQKGPYGIEKQRLRDPPLLVVDTQGQDRHQDPARPHEDMAEVGRPGKRRNVPAPEGEGLRLSGRFPWSVCNEASDAHSDLHVHPGAVYWWESCYSAVVLRYGEDYSRG
jgi:hypothetical protein